MIIDWLNKYDLETQLPTSVWTWLIDDYIYTFTVNISIPASWRSVITPSYNTCPVEWRSVIDIYQNTPIAWRHVIDPSYSNIPAEWTLQASTSDNMPIEWKSVVEPIYHNLPIEWFETAAHPVYVWVLPARPDSWVMPDP